MAKKVISNFEAYNILINKVCNLNAICLKSLSQCISAQNNDASAFTELWLSEKLQAYADYRNESVLKINNNIDNNLQSLRDSIKSLEQAIVNNYKLAYPESLKSITDLLDEHDEIIDEKMVELINKNNELGQKIFENYEQLVNLRASLRISIGFKNVISSYVNDLTQDGTKHLSSFINTNENVRTLSNQTIVELNLLVDILIKELKPILRKQGVLSNKMLNQAKKHPEDAELQQAFGQEMQYYNNLSLDLSNLEVLKIYVNAINNRYIASNTPKLELVDKILEAVIDLGYGVNTEIKKSAKPYAYEKAYVCKEEVLNMIKIMQSLPVMVPMISRMAYETGLSVNISFENYADTKIMLDVLKTFHSEFALNLKQDNPNLTDEQIKVQTTNPDMAKHLTFDTPLGKCWFDGTHCVNVETNKKIDLQEINKYFIKDGEIYKVESNENIAPDTQLVDVQEKSKTLKR